MPLKDLSVQNLPKLQEAMIILGCRRYTNTQLGVDFRRSCKDYFERQLDRPCQLCSCNMVKAAAPFGLVVKVDGWRRREGSFLI